MQFTALPKDIQKKVLSLQRAELTAHYIYQKIALRAKDQSNARVLEQVSQEELKAYKAWQSITQRSVEPSRILMWLFTVLAGTLGITFAIKFLELRERKGEQQFDFESICKYYPEEIELIKAPIPHEERLIALIDEKRVELMGSITLGLNDALVELTGTLAGLTLALNNNRIIALTGVIMGLTASLSMGASEYLSNRTGGAKNPLQAAYYTGGAYILAVVLLVFPFFVFSQAFMAIGVTLLLALLIILFFTFYLTVVKGYNFKQRFFEMAAISLGVAAISFGIGFVVQKFLGAEVM